MKAIVQLVSTNMAEEVGGHPDSTGIIQENSTSTTDEMIPEESEFDWAADPQGTDGELVDLPRYGEIGDDLADEGDDD